MKSMNEVNERVKEWMNEWMHAWIEKRMWKEKRSVLGKSMG